jgi:purine nucleosidase
VGVTTVTGNTAQRAALAEVICGAAGRPDVPIIAGLAGPLLHGPGQPNVPQYEAIRDLPHRSTDYVADGHGGARAVQFMRDAIRARPGQLTLLAVGPMTNVAALSAVDPEAFGLLRRIVLMCGVFQTGGPGAREWNALSDPVATALVFKHARPGTLLSVGLDVTNRCSLPRDECRTRFTEAGGPLGMVAKMAEVWFKNVPHITFHDPLAAALVFAPDLCRNENGGVSVVADDTPLAGMTRWTPARAATEPAPHTIAVDVDPERFFAHYFGVVNAAAGDGSK